jgi:hypothetical protein
MSQVEVERFLGRIITDADFRARAVTSLEKICFSEGFSLSAQEISILRHIDSPRFALIAETLDDSLRRN